MLVLAPLNRMCAMSMSPTLFAAAATFIAGSFLGVRSIGLILSAACTERVRRAARSIHGRGSSSNCSLFSFGDQLREVRLDYALHFLNGCSSNVDSMFPCPLLSPRGRGMLNHSSQQSSPNFVAPSACGSAVSSIESILARSDSFQRLLIAAKSLKEGTSAGVLSFRFRPSNCPHFAPIFPRSSISAVAGARHSLLAVRICELTVV